MKIKDNKIDEWPKSWHCVKEDIPYGQNIIKLMIPFIQEMKEAKLSVKTINEHIDNLWMLGGYIIGQLNDYDDKRHVLPKEMILECIDSGDGPWIHDFSEYEQERFGATCRKFYRYLKDKTAK
jgi:hypothetical protein